MERGLIKISCVTAVFNAIKSGNRESLIRCVESVSQLAIEHEHLIYDGASTDGTVELLRELGAKTPGLKVVSEPDRGIYNALNKGVRDAKGEWFYVLGCDDYICNPSVLDKLMVELTDDDDALVTTVRQETVNGESLWFTRVSELSGIFQFPCVCHQGEIMRTNLVRRFGGFDERYKIAADSDLFFKAHLSGCHFRYRFDVFAYFACEGTAMKSIDLALREHRTSVANVLMLLGRERDLMIEKSLLSYRMCFRMWSHPDLMIRQSARRMFRMRLKLYIRILLYPLVVISRPLRARLRRTWI